MKNFGWKISVIVTTYNKPGHLNLCLKSIRRQSVKPHQVVVADDGSGEVTAALIRKFQKNFPVPLVHAWQPDEGFRVARTRNNGLKASTGDYILYIDGDIVLQRNFIRDLHNNIHPGEMFTLSRFLLTEDYTGRLIGKKRLPLFILPKRGNMVIYGPEKWNKKALRRPFHKPTVEFHKDSARMEGAVMGSARKNWEAVNGFDNTFIGWGYEDNEVAERLLNAGLIIRRIENHRCLCFHLWHKSECRELPEDKREKYLRTVKEKRIRTENGLEQTEP